MYTQEMLGRVGKGEPYSCRHAELPGSIEAFHYFASPNIFCSGSCRNFKKYVNLHALLNLNRIPVWNSENQYILAALHMEIQMYTLLLSCMYVCDQSSHRQPIELFTTVSLIYGCSFPRDLVTSHFINLHLTMVFQYLKSTLHALVIAMSDKPRTSFQVVRNNLCRDSNP